MRHSALAQKYAKALQSAAGDLKTATGALKEIELVREALEGSPELKEFMTSPLINPSQRVTALEKALGSVKVSELVRNFVLVLAQKGRLHVLPSIVESLVQKIDEAGGVTRGTVESATPLTAEEKEQIEKRVSKATGREVILTYTINPKLIGGLVARVGGQTFDDSLISHLRRIREELTRSVH